MNRLKMLGLGIAAATFLLAFAGTAAATSLTSPAGTIYTGTIKAESEGPTSLHGTFATVTCGKSVVEGKVEQHGSAITAEGKVSSLTFSECNYPVTVKKSGTLVVHSLENGLGTLTSTGAEIVIHTSVGECVFTTSGTPIGTLTDSSITGGNATLDIGSVSIPRTGGTMPCGIRGNWTGSYRVSSPSALYLDPVLPHPEPSPLTSPVSYTGVIEAESEGATTLHGSFIDVSCQNSLAVADVETHTSSVVSGKLSHLTFADCNYPVTVWNAGSLEVQSIGGGKGTVTSSGAEIKIHSSVGECIFTTSATHIGTLTGSSITGGNATLDIESASIPRTIGSFFCGSSGEWTGSYEVTTPKVLFVGGSSALSSPTPYTGTIKAESEGATSLHGTFATVTCSKSAVEGKVESHSSGLASGKISALNFTECTTPVTVLKAGSLEVQSTGGGKATVKSTGAEITIETSVGDCVFTTNGTTVGTLTDSGLTGSNATLDIASAKIPRTGGEEACGVSGIWTGSYKVATPGALYTDPPSPVTAPSGTSYTGTIKAESEGMTTLEGSFLDVTCRSSAEGKLESHTSTTASGKITGLAFTECNYPVTVVKAGSLAMQSTGGGKGTISSTGADIRVHSSVGECVFTTSGTHIGTLTDSNITGGSATLDLESALIPRTGGSFFCGATGTWTGSFKVTTPSLLYVD
jgi:hypothetical protein